MICAVSRENSNLILHGGSGEPILVWHRSISKLLPSSTSETQMNGLSGENGLNNIALLQSWMVNPKPANTVKQGSIMLLRTTDKGSTDEVATT